ncbi:MAG: ferritin [Armatimonadota bacterium]|nr:ferritin [Armatimonadota bacterium]
MLISERMNVALNEQIGREFGASLQYVNIAAHFAEQNLPVLAAHFYRQAEEEREHALRIVRYVTDAGGHVAIPAVPGPKTQFATAEEAVKLSLEWEQEVTRQIHRLMDLAVKETDYTTQQMLQWFVEEQLEEVASMEELLSVVRRAGEGGLLLVEEFLARKGRAGDGA